MMVSRSCTAVIIRVQAVSSPVALAALVKSRPMPQVVQDVAVEAGGDAVAFDGELVVADLRFGELPGVVGLVAAQRAGHGDAQLAAGERLSRYP